MGLLNPQKRRIRHTEILRTSQSITNLPAGLVDIYREKILPRKTRTIRLLGRKCSAAIIHTFLGYEVKASHKRVHCPDLVTARFIKLFTELGCHSIKLPYDPTVTTSLIADLENSVYNISKATQELFPQDLKLQRYVTREIYKIVRRQIRDVQKSQAASIEIGEPASE